MDTIGLSVSFSNGAISESHNRRDYTPPNACAKLEDRNVGVVRTYDLRQSFNDFYKPAIDAYNAKQKHKDRKIDDDYYSKILLDGNGITPVFEYVLQFGNREDAAARVCDEGYDLAEWKRLKEIDEKDANDYVLEHANNSPEHERLKQLLVDLKDVFEKEFPNVGILSWEIHDDEPDGTIHAQIDVTFFGENYKKGMERQCSMTGAFKDMGFVKKQGEPEPVVKFATAVKETMAREMEGYGFHRVNKHNKEKRDPVNEFKARAEAVEALAAANSMLKEVVKETEIAELQRDALQGETYHDNDGNELLGLVGMLNQLNEMDQKVADQKEAIADNAKQIAAGNQTLANIEKRTKEKASQEKGVETKLVADKVYLSAMQGDEFVDRDTGEKVLGISGAKAELESVNAELQQTQLNLAKANDAAATVYAQAAEIKRKAEEEAEKIKTKDRRDADKLVETSRAQYDTTESMMAQAIRLRKEAREVNETERAMLDDMDKAPFKNNGRYPDHIKTHYEYWEWRVTRKDRPAGEKKPMTREQLNKHAQELNTRYSDLTGRSIPGYEPSL
ncbi:MAG: hypothetical protein IJ087_22210 [Eggerthellaceae bacterium]|nr:hypothetical protein [Eggerthellaceae bacterium]